MKYLVTFHTHFDAIQYMKFLKNRGITGRLQPVPRRVSSSCGTCTTFDCSDQVDLVEFLQEGCAQVFSIEGKEYQLLHKESEL